MVHNIAVTNQAKQDSARSGNFRTLEIENYGGKKTVEILDASGEERPSLKKPKYIISKNQIKLPTINSKKVGNFVRVRTGHISAGTGI